MSMPDTVSLPLNLHTFPYPFSTDNAKPAMASNLDKTVGIQWSQVLSMRGDS